MALLTVSEAIQKTITNISDFIKKNGVPLGDLKFFKFSSNCTSECSFFVTEKLALHKSFWNRTAMNGNGIRMAALDEPTMTKQACVPLHPETILVRANQIAHFCNSHGHMWVGWHQASAFLTRNDFQQLVTGEYVKGGATLLDRLPVSEKAS